MTTVNETIKNHINLYKNPVFNQMKEGTDERILKRSTEILIKDLKLAADRNEPLDQKNIVALISTVRNTFYTLLFKIEASPFVLEPDFLVWLHKRQPYRLSEKKFISLYRQRKKTVSVLESIVEAVPEDGTDFSYGYLLISDLLSNYLHIYLSLNEYQKNYKSLYLSLYETKKRNMM